jgi:hypothetical protein
MNIKNIIDAVMTEARNSFNKNLLEGKLYVLRRERELAIQNPGFGLIGYSFLEYSIRGYFIKGQGIDTVYSFDYRVNLRTHKWILIGQAGSMEGKEFDTAKLYRFVPSEFGIKLAEKKLLNIDPTFLSGS